MVYVSLSKTPDQAFKGFVIAGEADHENRTGCIKRGFKFIQIVETVEKKTPIPLIAVAFK